MKPIILTLPTLLLLIGCSPTVTSEDGQTNKERAVGKYVENPFKEYKA